MTPPRTSGSDSEDEVLNYFQEQDFVAKQTLEEIVIPKPWRKEIMNECSKVALRILEGFGPLGVILYIRIDRLSKDDFDMFDLSMLNVNSDGMKFI